MKRKYDRNNIISIFRAKQQRAAALLKVSSCSIAIIIAMIATTSITAAAADTTGEPEEEVTAPNIEAASDEETEGIEEVAETEENEEPKEHGTSTISEELTTGESIKADAKPPAEDEENAETEKGYNPGAPSPHKTDIGTDTLESTLTIVSGSEATEAAAETEPREIIPEEELVEAPTIEPEGSEEEYNIFGQAGAYFVSVPKSMSFVRLSNGDFETSSDSYYTVNSVLDNSYQLQVAVSGINTDDTVELTNETNSIYRKVEVKTTASDVWEYRPDGTRLTVSDADQSGYGSGLILEGPGRFKAKCRLSQYGDDELHAGTWTGSILFTVTCTPEPDQTAVDGAIQKTDPTQTSSPQSSNTTSQAAPAPSAPTEGIEGTTDAAQTDTVTSEDASQLGSDILPGLAADRGISVMPEELLEPGNIEDYDTDEYYEEDEYEDEDYYDEDDE